jgi:hypothetical protein
MRKTIIILSFCLIALPVFAQVNENPENKSGTKLTKEQKLAERQAKAESVARNVEWMVLNRRFVIEADYISDQTGRRIVVNSLLNFIRIDSSQISIQIAPHTARIGANGLGGITADGTAVKWEMKRFGKNQQLYSITLSAKMIRAGTYGVMITIGKDGSVQATLSGNDAAKIIFYGKLVSLEESKVYKGTRI